MSDFFPLIVGFLGSLHCLGMCGPLVLAYSLHLNGSGAGGANASSSVHAPRGFGFLHHAAFHCGRLATYGILGALAAALFRAADIGSFYASARGSMNVLGGILLVALGLMLFKIMPIPSFLVSATSPMGRLLGRRLPVLLRSRSIQAGMALGLAIGFMPCCLSWAMIVTAATTQDPLDGFIAMILFGLGTIPALFLAGISASIVSIKVRFMGERLAAVSVVAMGLVLILRGVGILA